ncbi:MAG: nucleotide exchange factor GrpE [Candidatus Borkfalkiaceae bacterium]|nr:nucleotide exchange factor GrpE [Christensenellaceae bacterium]
MSKNHEHEKLKEKVEAAKAEEKTEVSDEKEITEESPADELKALTEENQKLRKEIEETKNDYLRARADCENVRKRTSAEISRAYDDGRLEAITKVLPIGDSLDWALKMPLEDKTREGIELLLKKYHESLVALGVKEFSPDVGTAFDPGLAEAVMQVEAGEGETSGNVKQVFGRGYKLGEKVIRYAQVSVIK